MPALPGEAMDIVTRDEANKYMRDLLGNQLPSEGVPAQLITDLSRRMARHTGREDWGPREVRTEYLDGDTRFLPMRFWPLNAVTNIWDDIDHVWGDNTVIDSSNYWFPTGDDDRLGIIYMENWQLSIGDGNVKVTYTGGYNGTANVAGDIKTACFMQLQYEIQRNKPGRFQTVPGQFEEAAFSEFEGIGLLGEVRVLLNKYKRSIPY